MTEDVRNELRKRFKEFQTNLWKDYHAEPPKYLYHYSPPEGIEGILKTKELWVSDIQRLNDKREGIYLLSVFGPILGRKSVHESMKERFRDAETLFRLGERWFGYVASFCATRDVESQWKYYAADGTGCAIEIDLEALYKQSNLGNRYSLFRLLYDAGEQRAKAEATTDHAIQTCREMEIPKKDLGHFWIEATISSFLDCGIRFKDPKYTPEEEWRVMMLRPDRTTASVRTVENKQVHYIRLPLNDLVHGVLRGPNGRFSEEEIQRMLRG